MRATSLLLIHTGATPHLVESNTDEEDDSGVSREVIIIAAVIVVAGVASLLFLGLSGAPNGEDPNTTEVNPETNPTQETVTVSLVSLGSADHVAVLGLERYDDEGDVPYLSQPGGEAVFDFSDSNTEDNGTLTVVAVEGEVDDSGEMDTTYGSGVRLGEIDREAARIIVENYNFDFS